MTNVNPKIVKIDNTYQVYGVAGEELPPKENVVAKEDGYLYRQVEGYAVVGKTLGHAEKGDDVLVELSPIMRGVLNADEM